MQDNQEAETSSDKVQERKRENKNPSGGEIFRIRPEQPSDPPSLLYNGCMVSFLGVKAVTVWC
jgi:hypothetical protein